ncbi:hypothetical protein G6O67_003786 [Ophiocordyceps sinensis]|uniref:Uncharacterized protein n=1 Tax=Ophiocordyceps sinensis TaxID=72228 RepID=A0A8H4PSP3_9HYPO|nr:hypothetical protein G6O67_003786 [Ophiocordyceps sinensis]
MGSGSNTRPAAAGRPATNQTGKESQQQQQQHAHAKAPPWHPASSMRAFHQGLVSFMYGYSSQVCQSTDTALCSVHDRSGFFTSNHLLCRLSSPVPGRPLPDPARSMGSIGSQ